MDRCRWFATIVVAVLFAVDNQEAAGQPTPRATVAVTVYDYARVAPRDMTIARAKVTAIVSSASVDIVWSGPSSSATRFGAGAGGCRQPFTVQVMIRPRRAGWEPGRKRIMGEALAADDSRAVLSLFYDAIFDVALRYRVSIDEILAVALAHEIGHALLPPPAHTNTGVMQARWEGDDIRHAVAQALKFDERQAGVIRAKAERQCALSRSP